MTGMHGTRSGYKKGCRCLPCADANRIYMNNYRAKKAGREPYVRSTDSVQHGTIKGYRRCAEQAQRGEREETCMPCRLAWRARRKDERDREARPTFSPTPVPNGPACSSPDVDPEWFFTIDPDERPELTQQERYKINDANRYKALKVCGVCEIREQCLSRNVDMEFGIVGGTTERQRQKLRVSASEGSSFFATGVAV